MSRRRAIVTGASSGIGKAAAAELAERGFDVAIGYRTDATGATHTADLVAAAGGRAYTFVLDLADPDGAAQAVERAIDVLGGVDVLVNNAGVNHRSTFVAEALSDWNRILTVDLTAPFSVAQAVAKRMISQGTGGRIIHVSSVHELIPIRDGAAYCAAKAGLGMLNKVMALELAAHGITVNSVCPGETATPMNGVTDGRDAATIARPGIPVGRPARPEEVAGLIGHLTEPVGDYITGTSHVIDGGLALMSAILNQADAGRL
jgi:NAD(P)-dependent dehydrogenase (short-subunit alcohol dehydrogenase family)